MRRKRFARGALSLGLVLVVAFPSAALAHRIYAGWIDVWSNGGNCLNEKITQDHGETSWGYHPNGYWLTESDAEKQVNTSWGTVNCAADWDRPPGYLRTRTKALKYRSSTNTWELCFDTDWRENTVTAHGWNVGASAGNDPNDNPPCGDGIYTPKGKVEIWHNGAWRGGPLSTNEAEELY